MKLYDYALAPSPKRTRIFLAEKGLEVENVQVDMARAKQLSDAYRKVNPRCTVPSLELDDGTVLTENVAIALYLEETHPEPPLLGRTPAERALALEWNAIVEFQGLLPLADAFRNSSPAFADRATTGPINYAQIPELAARGLARARAFFAALDERLDGRDFIATDAYSFADITALVVVDFAKFVALEPADDQKSLRGWYARASSRPSASA